MSRFHRLGLESARATACKGAACMRQTFLSKTFANSLNMQKQCEKMLGKRVMTSTLVDKSTDHDKPHFDLFFYRNMNMKINTYFQSAS